MAGLSNQDTVGVIGAGIMGAGIAQVAAAAGHPVLLYDAKAGAAEAGIARIRDGLEGLVNKGKMRADARDALVSRITPVAAPRDMTGAKLVIEAIIEDLAAKASVLRDLEAYCPATTIIASNTSSISITALAAGLQHRERLVGMHFFNPAPIMKLVEVVSGLDTSAEVAACVHAISRAWGKIPVHARSTPGFIVNRVARPFYGEALRLLEEGAAPVRVIDEALRACGGFRMGPFELMDLIGMDVNYAVTKSVFEAIGFDSRYRPSLVQKDLLDAGYLGRKTGRGFYTYGDTADQTPLPYLEPCGAPRRLMIDGDIGPVGELCALWQSAGIDLVHQPGAGLIRGDGFTLALTDGRMATARSADDALPNLILLDLCADFSTCTTVLIAAADQADSTAVASAVGALQAVGKRALRLEDVAGMIVMRTVAMLANAAVNAVGTGIATAGDVDTAMRYGVNYPRGPIEWANAIGGNRIATVIQHLQATYGESRYRLAPRLLRMVKAGTPLA
jgi:3-hydroxybutyryl-CoA dehydrogenase